MIEINFLTIDDHSRVCLTNIPGKHGSDYINASFIDVSLLVYSCSNTPVLYFIGISQEKAVHCSTRFVSNVLPFI